MYCLACFKGVRHSPKAPSPWALCPSCERLFNDLKSPRDRIITGEVEKKPCSFPLLTSYSYQSPLRAMIHRAKIRGDLRALQMLGDLALMDTRLEDALNNVDAIVAAPSSFWGRLRGRLDLGYYLGERLASIGRKPLLSAPNQLYWRLKKRARREQKLWSPSDLQVHLPRHLPKPVKSYLSKPNPSYPLRLLIVDDIVTTGYTFSSIAFHIPDRQLTFYALADAMG